MSMSKATVKIVSLVIVWALALSIGGILHASQDGLTSDLAAGSPSDLTVTLGVTGDSSGATETSLNAFSFDAAVLEEWIQGPGSSVVEGYSVDNGVLTLTLKNNTDANVAAVLSTIPLRLTFNNH